MESHFFYQLSNKILTNFLHSLFQQKKQYTIKPIDAAKKTQKIFFTIIDREQFRKKKMASILILGKIAFLIVRIAK